MTQEAPEGGVLETAVQRLDRAMGQLERRLESLAAEAQGANGELFDLDRAKLAAELDAARARERDLEAAGSQASAALGRAIAEIRSALGDDPGQGDRAKEA
jgi:predicted  nucleic acid-binding Zn-ribbon protein